MKSSLTHELARCFLGTSRVCTKHGYVGQFLLSSSVLFTSATGLRIRVIFSICGSKMNFRRSESFQGDLGDDPRAVRGSMTTSRRRPKNRSKNEKCRRCCWYSFVAHPRCRWALLVRVVVSRLSIPVLLASVLAFLRLLLRSSCSGGGPKPQQPSSLVRYPLPFARKFSLFVYFRSGLKFHHRAHFIHELEVPFSLTQCALQQRSGRSWR